MDVTWFAEQLLKSGEVWQDQALAFVEMRLGEVKPALQDKLQNFTHAQTVDRYRRWLSEKYLLYSKAKQALDMESEKNYGEKTKRIEKEKAHHHQRITSRQTIRPHRAPDLSRKLR
jgi:hypothetical protein